MNKWIRQIHRWLSMGFIVALALTLATTNAEEPPGILAIGALLTLASLLMTGLYLFALPYATKWRRRRAQRAA